MKCIRLLLFIALLLGQAPVWAQTGACGILAIPMAFGGGYDAIGSAPLHGNGQVTVTCNQPAIVRLGPGQYSSGTFSPRKMRTASGGMTLDYNLFVDATYSRIWGDGTTSTFIQNVGPGANTLTIYGQIMGGQRVPVGMYQDLIVISVEW